MMHQIKIFKALEFDTDKLENDVNRWLAASRVKVVQMFGNIAPQSESPTKGQLVGNQGGTSPSDVVIVILYEPPPTPESRS